MGKESELYQLIREQDLQGIQKLFKKDQRIKSKFIGSSRKLNINAQDREGTSPLHLAAFYGNQEIVRILLDHSAIVDVKDHKGKRPLHNAIERGYYSIIMTLLDWRSNPNEASYDGRSPLHVTCWRGDHNIVRYLLQFGADPSRIDHQHRTPLHVACEQGYYQAAEILLQSGLCDSMLETAPYEDMSDHNRTTILHLAARNGHADVVRLLLDSGVDVNRQTLQGTSLHEAAQYNRIHVVKLLLERGVDTVRLNSYNQTALDIASKQASKSTAAKDIRNLLREVNYATSTRAVKDYNLNMSEPGHLSFKEGDLIRVVEKHPSGLWKGCVISPDGQPIRNGYFPASSVMPTDALGNRPMSNYSSDSSNSDRSPIPVMSPHVPDPYARPHLYHVTVTAQNDYDRDSGISPGQHSVSSLGAQSFGKPSTHQTTAPLTVDRTAEWVKHCSVAGSDGHSPVSSSRGSPSGSNRSSLTSTNSGTLSNHYGSFLSQPHQSTFSNGVQQNRLSRESYESGVSVSHGGSTSSLGSLDRMEESGYTRTVNVGDLLRQGYQDHEVLRRWLSDLNLEEYHHLFITAGYDLPTISRMTPEDLTAIGVQKPAHRKRLKAEISKMHIHDGLPEHLPSSLEDWLGYLGMMEYHENLASQGYQETDRLTDIAWEDLEDFKITRLGHQKKLLLAVDRLRRIKNNTYHPNPSPATRQSSREHLLDSSPVPSPVNKYSHYEFGSGTHLSTQRSPSSDHLGPRLAPLDPRLAPLDLRSFQLSHEEGQQAQHSPGRLGNIVHLQQLPNTNLQPDIVPIHVNRPMPSSPAHMSKTAADGGTHFSFQSPPVSGPSSSKSRHSSGGSTPTPSTEDAANLRMTLRRPAARVSPLPKPKPTIGKILAKNKHMENGGSGDKLNRIQPPDLISSAASLQLPKLNDPQRSSGYSSGTLGRKNSSHSSHIYDAPADSPSHMTNGPTTAPTTGPTKSQEDSADGQGNSPGGVSWLEQMKARKAPPPPPKRSASIKNGKTGVGIRDRLNSLEESGFTASSEQTIPTNGASPHHAVSNFSSCVQSLSSKFNHKTRADDGDSDVSRDENDSPEPEFPPPPPPLSMDYTPMSLAKNTNGRFGSHVRVATPSSSNVKTDRQSAVRVATPSSSNVKTDRQTMKQKEMESLDSVLQQLQDTSANIPERKAAPRPSAKPSLPPKFTQHTADLNFDSDASQTDSQNSDSDTESISAQCEAVLERTSSTGTIDSNTLPFANENVGTIKQKTAQAKAAAAASSSEDSSEMNAEVNDDMFQEGSGTIKRNRAATSQPLSGPSKESPRPMKKPTVTSPKPVVPPKTANGPVPKNNEDVFGDIGNMLENLTSELDAMLDTEAK